MIWCFTSLFQHYLGHSKQKCAFEHAQNAHIQIHPSNAQFHPGNHLSLIHSIVINDSIRGQQRPRSDCADAQADLGLCCPQTFKAHLSHIEMTEGWWWMALCNKAPYSHEVNSTFSGFTALVKALFFFQSKSIDIFLISPRKHMLWVLIRSASPRRF